MKRFLMISTAAAARGELKVTTGFARRLTGVVVCLFALAATGMGQVTKAWVARYNGPSNLNDGADALAVDAAGNVYVAGYSRGTGTRADYATIKYDSDGDQLWLARYDGPVGYDDEASALAVDAAANVYVTGSSYGAGTDYDYATIKYDSNGNELWVARYNGPGNSGDAATALAVDAAGNVYVTGWSQSAGTYTTDYATIKYDSNGNQLWVARYNGTENGSDAATALAVAGAGNVYVTGYSDGEGTGVDYATMKYDSNGNELWVARYNGPGNSRDYAEALGVDAAGNAYVTGSSRGAAYEDYATIKYDSNGNQLWVSRYDGPVNFNDHARALSPDAVGNVYVTGWSEGVGTSSDYATIKYDSNGNQLWVARYNGPGNSVDDAATLAVDGAGNVYVAGYSYGTGTDYDYATVKYDSNGNQLWVSRYNGPGNYYDWANAVAVDAAGNVYVTGISRGLGSYYDYATIKYTQPATVSPSSFTVTRGYRIGGGLADLLLSDDAYLAIQARPRIGITDPDIQLVVQGTAQAETSSYFLFRLEAACNGFPLGNVRQRIELYNYQQSRWEQVDERVPTFNDSVVEVTFTENAQRFIQPGTKTIKARIGWYNRGVLSPNWYAAIDQTAWEIAP